MSLESPLRTWQGRTVRGPHDTETSVALRVGDQLALLGNRLSGSLFFVPSPLEGWGLDVLAEHLGEGSVIVCFEKDATLAAALHNQVEERLGDVKERLYWLSVDDEEAVRALCRQLPLHSLRRVEWFPVSGGWLLASGRYREISARLDRELKTYWSNRLTSMHLGPLWIRNLFENWSGHEVSLPWPDWKDDDVIVCGAGTSLEPWLPRFPSLRNKVRILVADTALPCLTAAGVIPDGVVCLESQQVNLKDFLPAAGLNIPLFCDLSTYPATTRALKGSTYWFCTPFENLTLWERLNQRTPVVTLPPLGSVGVAAVAVAHLLTRGRVFLVGLDFSWPRGKTHARGSPSLTGLLVRANRLSGFEQNLNWLREGVLDAPEPHWYTSRVLQGYADVLRELAVAEHGRTWILGTSGLDVGLARLDQIPEFSCSNRAVITSRPYHPAPAVLKPEIQSLELVIGLIEKLNEAPEEEALWDDLRRALRDVDYLFFSFPDPQIRRDSSFLSRVLILARWMRERLLVVVAGLENR